MHRFVLLLLGLATLSSLPLQALTFRESQLELVMHPGIAHTRMTMPVFHQGVPFAGNLSAQADVPWVTPAWDPVAHEIVLTFSATNLLKTETATIRAVIPGQTNEFFVHANLAVPQVVRMIADPQRPRIYALHQAGVGRGSLIVLDAETGQPSESRTLGLRPTDLVANSTAGELLILHSVDRNVVVLGLGDLLPRLTLPLPEFQNWGADSTEANLGIGPGNVLYYTDGSWAPVLYVWNRVTGQILQRVNIDSNGFGGFAVSPDLKSLIGWAQYGWSAGWGGSYLARHDIAADGTLTWRQGTGSQWPTEIVRDPFDAPVLFDPTGSRVFVKQLAVDAGNVTQTIRAFPSTVYAISPGGEFVCTANALIHTVTGAQLLSTGPMVQPVITPDYFRLVYFNAANRSFAAVNLITELGPTVLGLEREPADGAVVVPPARLKWIPVLGASGYRVYWGTDRESVRLAGTGSPEFRGETPTFQWTADLPSELGRTYHWRVDSLVNGTAVTGPVLSFTVLDLQISASRLQGSTLAGLRTEVAAFDVSSPRSNVEWQVSSPDPWISFSATSGTVPGRIGVIVDASQLAVGVHVGTVLVGTSPETTVSLPLQVRVDPLFVTVLQSDPDSVFAYAISEDTQTTPSKAQLLEINTATEQIVRRVEVGSSATDLALHRAEGRIYVTNWRLGALLAVNRETFQIEQTYAFSPFGGVGTSEGDAYRIAAGGAGRIVVEEADQWVDISLFDTRNGVVLQRAFVREGGGKFDPAGRYYYHGENNSSGATIQRYDTAGNGFSLLASVRVESADYYGSRVVTVSDDGSRVFWNGSAFDATLKELWSFGEHVYACTPDGRLAFARDKILDISRRAQVLQMPVSTTVSAYNGSSQKLIVQQGGTLRFYPLDPAAVSLPAPELSVAETQADRVALRWVDRSLEMSFIVQMRQTGSPVWSDLPAQVANATQYTVTGLQPESAYEFRIRAVAGTLSSPWSEVAGIATPGFPPTAPVWSETAATFRGIRLGWSNPERETGLLLERRTNSAAWVAVTLPADTTSYFDTNVVSGGSYQYRISATNRWAATTPAATELLLVPFPTPPAQPRLLSLQMLAEAKVRVLWEPTLETDRYEVERRDPGMADWKVVGLATNAVSQWLDSVSGLGQVYAYRVVAVNAYGRSTPSMPLQIVTERLTQLLSDTFEDGLSRVMWESVTGAQLKSGSADFPNGRALWFGLGESRMANAAAVPVRNGTSLEFSLRTASPGDTNALWELPEPGEGLAVEYSLNGTAWFSAALIDLPSLNSPGTWLRHSVALPPQATGNSTRVRLRQLAHSGAAQDTWAIDDIALVGPISTTPVPPSWVMASAVSATEIALVWERVPQATAYRVERFAGKSGWTHLALVPAREPWFTDEQAVPGGTYRYQVRALLGTEESVSSRTVLGQAISQAAEWSLQETGVAIAEPASLPESQLIRYAFNLGWDTPLGPNLPGLPQITVNPVSGRASFQFVRRKAAMNPGVEYWPEASADLVNWVPFDGDRSVESLNALWESVQCAADPNSAPRQFFRIRVMPKPMP